jgi:two-component system, NtrC family, response regulator GlrR
MSFYLHVIEQIVPSCFSLCSLLSREDFKYERSDWNSFQPEALRKCKAQTIVAVTVSEPNKAQRLFDWLHLNSIKIPTLAVLPEDSDAQFFQSATEVVDDFLLWPVRPLELRRRLERLLGPCRDDLKSLRQLLTGEVGMAEIAGHDPAFVKVLNHIPLVSASHSPVLLLGETGTGKELFARAIHMLSPRRSGPFIPVECGAVPEHLAENELFGHVHGAFTDAHRDQKGLVALAEGGTLFLDEVDSLSLAAQAKLLRFLQEGTYRPLGSERFMRGDVRVIAASNRDLEACVEGNQFRADLYFRLNVLRLHLPPLRERSSDIEALARHFLEKQCLEEGLPRRGLTPAALRKLQSYHWPGNVRELYNVLQRAAVFCRGPQINLQHISLPGTAEAENEPPSNFRAARAAAIQSFERSFTRELLQKHHGNITHASREAGKDRRAFGRLVKKYNIDRNNP